MAQPNDTRKTTPADALNVPRPQNSPGSKSSSTKSSPHSQHLQGGSSSWSPYYSPKPKKNNDHDDRGNHNNKKSMFTKVKEKARKLKKSLSTRKRRDDNELRSPYITPPGSACPVEDDDNDRPEFFGSPTYEASGAPDADKASSEKHNPSTMTEPPLSLGTTDNVPKATTVDTSPETMDSKLSGLTISTKPNATENQSEAKENNVQTPQDKGVSVKEYIMNKFEPGEDERALSQVITQTISPRCERMKDAMNSFLGNEDSNDSNSKTSNSELDITPSTSSIESSSLNNHPNLGNALESNLSNASNISQCSNSTSASLQNQIPSSNLKPNSDLNSNLNTSDNVIRDTDPASSTS